MLRWCFPTHTSRTRHGRPFNISNARPNDRLEYLVLLSPDDDSPRRCCEENLRDVLFDSQSELQGTLHIAVSSADTCECCGVHYKIEGIAHTHELYAKLPKEQIYVRVGAWEHEYLKSQVQELVYIFRKLGARELDIIVNQGDESSKNLVAEMRAGLGSEYNVSGGLRNTDSHRSLSSIRTHLWFPSAEAKSSASTEKCVRLKLNSDGPVTEKELLRDPAIHYLHQKPDWMNVVRERLNGFVSEIALNFLHFNTIHIQKDFRIRVSRMGIRLSLADSEYMSVSMDFKVRFLGTPKKADTAAAAAAAAAAVPVPVAAPTPPAPPVAAPTPPTAATAATAATATSSRKRPYAWF